jgi:HK97 family phage portal protein
MKDLNDAIKKSFPNLDPNFFKAPHSTVSDSGDVVDPYSNNVWVYSACTAIATNLIQLPKVLDLTNTEEEELITLHPILDLFNNPNPMMSASAFWEAIILNLLLPTNSTKGGQCFLIMEKGNGQPASLRAGDIPKEIYPFSDANISPIISKQSKMLEGWLLKGANGEKIPYTLDEVIRIYLYDPSNPLKGQCPLWAARSGLRQDKKASAVNESFFDNNASLGGTLSTDAELEDDEIKALRKQWHETYGGAENGGKTAVLHTGLKFEQFQRTHVDMQFIEQKKYSRDEIMAVYRVPKAEISLYEDINYATAQAANKSFWQKTLIPHDGRILEALNSQWIQYIDNGKYELISDLTKVEALQEDFTEKLEQAKKLADLHVPVEEINRRLDLSLKIDEYPWLKTSLVNYSLAPAGDVMSRSDEEELEEEEEVATDPETIEESTDKLYKTIEKVHKANEERTSYADNYAKKVLAPDEKLMLKTINKFFVGQRNRYQDLVDKWTKGKNKKDINTVTKIEEEIPASVFKLDPKKEAFKLREMLLPIYKKLIKNEATQVEAEIGPLVNWDERHPSVKELLKKRLKKVVGVNGTSSKIVADKIKKAITKAVEENYTIAQTTKLLKQEIGAVYKKPFRAKTIARTETGIIHGETRYSVMKADGVENIEWLTARDELVRGASGPAEFPHDILDGEVTKLGTPFNNGEEITHPHAQGASAGNVINCRCTFRMVRNKDE